MGQGEKLNLFLGGQNHGFILNFTLKLFCLFYLYFLRLKMRNVFNVQNKVFQKIFKKQLLISNLFECHQ